MASKGNFVKVTILGETVSFNGRALASYTVGPGRLSVDLKRRMFVWRPDDAEIGVKEAPWSGQFESKVSLTDDHELVVK